MNVLCAWFFGHRLGPVLMCSTALTCGALLAADTRVPGLLSGVTFPLWLMYPPTISMILGTATASRLPEFNNLWRIYFSRVGLVVFLVLIAWLMGLVVQEISSQSELASCTVLMVLVTVALSRMVGWACIFFGGGVNLVIILKGAATWDQAIIELLPAISPEAKAVALVLVTLGVGWFVRDGARGQNGLDALNG